METSVSPSLEKLLMRYHCLRNKQKHSNFNTLGEQDRGGPEGSSMNRTELKEQIPQSQKKERYK